jgi:hypothetical protein
MLAIIITSENPAKLTIASFTIIPENTHQKSPTFLYAM